MPKATCSFSAKWLSTFRSRTMRPTGRSGKRSSGHVLVSSSGSNSSSGCSSSLMSCTRSSHSGNSPRSIASWMSFEALPSSVAWIASACGLGQRPDALRGLPVVLDEHGLAGGVDHPVRVDAEALHEAVVGRDAARAEQPREHVHRLGRQAHEVEDAVRLLAERDRIRLQGVDHVRELDRVPDEEHRQVVADEVPVAVLGLELHREAAGVAGRPRRSRARRSPWRSGRRPGCACPSPGRASPGCTSPAGSSPIAPYASKWPWATKPRAWTTRSGMRSRSKWLIFSRNW